MQTNVRTLAKVWKPRRKNPLPDVDEDLIRDEVAEEFEESANEDEYENIKLKGYKEDRSKEETNTLQVLVDKRIKEEKAELQHCRKIIDEKINCGKRIGIRRKFNEDEITQTIGLFEENPTYRDLLYTMQVFIDSRPYEDIDIIEFEETEKSILITFSTVC